MSIAPLFRGEGYCSCSILRQTNRIWACVRLNPVFSSRNRTLDSLFQEHAG
jgi:hypothetical protein